MNTKTIIELLDGTLNRIHPETEAAVLALTLADVEAARKPGRHGPKVPGEVTFDRIEKMKELGWPAAWIAREAGYKSNTVQVSADADGCIPTKVAERVQAVWDRLGGREAPPRKCRTPLPSLDELDAAKSA